VPPPGLVWHHQKAVLWTAQTVRGRKLVDAYGEAKVNAPVEIDVRWVFGRSEVLDSSGTAVAVDATAEVEQEVPEGSQMWLGALEDWLGTGSGDEDSGLMYVKAYNEALDIKGRVAARTVGLMYFRDQPAAQS